MSTPFETTALNMLVALGESRDLLGPGTEKQRIGPLIDRRQLLSYAKHRRIGCKRPGTGRRCAGKDNLDGQVKQLLAGSPRLELVSGTHQGPSRRQGNQGGR